MRPYSSVNALCGLSYTGVTGTQVLKHFRETGSEFPKLYAGAKKKKKNLKSLVSHILSNKALLLFQGHLRVQLYLFYRYFGIRSVWEKRVQIPPNNAQGYTKSKLKSLAPHFTSIKAFSVSDLYGSSYTCYSGIEAIQGNWTPISQIICRDTQNNPKSLAPDFTSNEALLLCQGDLRVQLYLFCGYLGIRESRRNWA